MPHTATITGMSTLASGLARLYAEDCDTGRPLAFTVVDPPKRLDALIGEVVNWDAAAMEYKGKVIAEMVESVRRGEMRIRFTKSGTKNARVT